MSAQEVKGQIVFPLVKQERPIMYLPPWNSWEGHLVTHLCMTYAHLFRCHFYLKIWPLILDNISRFMKCEEDN